MEDAPILISHIDALRDSLERIRVLFVDKLVKSKDEDIKAYSGAIYSKFLITTNPRSETLKTLRQRLLAKTITTGAAWKEYMDLLNESDQIFAQCLDFLGGIALRKFELEAGTCALAETLIKELQTGTPWSSVLILGEERLLDEVSKNTQIIRLRFPEWDIWSLPLAAYELGRLVAVEGARETVEKLVIAEQRALRNYIMDDVPDPEIAQNVAQEIQKLRDQFREKTIDAAVVEAYLAKQEYSIQVLVADAFATHFLGPAYVYSRLYRRFRPTEALTSNGDEPPLAMRMAVMLQALHEMSEDSKRLDAKDKYEVGPYHSECGRIRGLWQDTVQTSIDPAYDGALHFGQPFDSRFAQIYERLSTRYRHLGFSASQWSAATELGDGLLEMEISDHEPKRPVTVLLNAAWHRRIRQPDRLEDIEERIRRLSQPVATQIGNGDDTPVSPKPPSQPRANGALQRGG